MRIVNVFLMNICIYLRAMRSTQKVIFFKLQFLLFLIEWRIPPNFSWKLKCSKQCFTFQIHI